MNDQAINLRRKVNHHKQSKSKAKTISIISGKGGVGKSNFAVNFALELIHANKRVILFDLDVGMGNVDILLGLQAKKTIIDMLNDKLSIYEILENGPKGLSYIAGGSNLTEFFTLNTEKMDYFLKQYEEISYLYDYVLFDLGAGINKDSLFFTLSSDEIFVVTTPEPTAITDAYSMIKHILSKEQRIPFFVVMNQATSQKDGLRILNSFSNVIHKFLHINVNKLGILPTDPSVREAVMKQTPYTLLKRNSPISKAIKLLVQTYIDEKPVNKNIIQTSFVQRLKQLFLER